MPTKTLYVLYLHLCDLELFVNLGLWVPSSVIWGKIFAPQACCGESTWPLDIFPNFDLPPLLSHGKIFSNYVTVKWVVLGSGEMPCSAGVEGRLRGRGCLHSGQLLMSLWLWVTMFIPLLSIYGKPSCTGQWAWEARRVVTSSYGHWVLSLWSVGSVLRDVHPWLEPCWAADAVLPHP